MRDTFPGQRTLALGLITVVSALLSTADARQTTPARIDRHALVARHNPVLRHLDADAPLSVGNGRFAFTADVTGLQTFAESYDETVPLGTLSDWGWHTAPNPEGWSIEKYHFAEFDSHGRPVGYADIPGDRRTPEVQWLRANPHRLHLGRVGFDIRTRDGRQATPADISAVEQTLDMWRGVLTSRFSFDGEPVVVETVCHPDVDALAVRVQSPLVRQQRLGIRLAFPYGTGQATAADWSKPEAHETVMSQAGPRSARFARRLDADRYMATASWAPSGDVTLESRHTFRFAPRLAAGASVETFDFIVHFEPAAGDGLSAPAHPAPNAARGDRSDAPAGDRANPPAVETSARDLAFDPTRLAAGRHWQRFWTEGGAIDISGSRDPRWRELERRIVLSQYLTAIQCAGRTPPQETGLTYNSWEGKFHLEMHWWHAAQFALWNRLPLLDASLDYYRRILPAARATAARQGYRGARWPKMTGPTGAESPSTVGPFLVWQQPHPIFYAELVYRAHPTRATLERFREVVFETAEFMASFPARDAATDRHVLGPPLHCAQEVFPKATTTDCTYELAYWRWGFEKAQAWRTRLGLPREAAWDRVAAALAPLPVVEGKYAFAGSALDSFTNPRWRRDHPVVVSALGVLPPGPHVDADTMRRTFDWIWDNWNWTDTWGWDYPMLAMTAARVGRPDRAIDALLLDATKNVYRVNGHNYQRPGLTIYLPGNGGLLYAAAMMAAGWEGGPDRPAPGFPADGTWTVRYENLSKAF